MPIAIPGIGISANPGRWILIIKGKKNEVQQRGALSEYVQKPLLAVVPSRFSVVADQKQISSQQFMLEHLISSSAPYNVEPKPKQPLALNWQEAIITDSSSARPGWLLATLLLKRREAVRRYARAVPCPEVGAVATE